MPKRLVPGSHFNDMNCKATTQTNKTFLGKGSKVQGSHRPGKVLEFDLGSGKLLEFEKKCLLSGNFVKSSLKI